MAFQDYEDSANLGQPIELYLFEYGTLGSFYAYTNATKQVTLDGVAYKPTPIGRDSFSIDGKANDDSLKIEVSLGSEISDLYRFFPPSQIVTLTIRQGHIPSDGSITLTATDFMVIWKGTIRETARNGAFRTLTGELISSNMNRPGLRIHYQWPCPLVLYGARCGADKTAATVSGTIATLVQNRMTITGSWVPVDRVEDDFIGGFIEWDGPMGKDYRTILDVQSGELVLNGVPPDLDPGDTVSVVLGCPHTLQGCITVHSNSQNYGGQPFIPRRNPTGKNNHY